MAVVRSERSPRPDWRDAEAYAALLGADRSLIAWEWLRRDIAYVHAWEAAGSAGSDAGAAPFGLVAFEAPDRSVPEARPLWRSDVYSQVLPVVRGCSRDSRDCCAVKQWRDVATLLSDHDGEHLLVSDGLRTIRLDGEAGLFSGDPICLGYRLEGLVTAEPRVLVLRRFLAFCRTGRFARSLHPPELRARRWVLMLRAWDALSQGAHQREIAEVLLASGLSAGHWRLRQPSLRSEVQRLARAARAAATGGYRALLDHRPA